MKIGRFKLTDILLIILVAAALFFRLYRLSHTQTFLEDEGRDLLIVKRMLDLGRPVLLGPQTSIGSMYLGPFYYYFITPALALSGLDPIGPAVLVALTGALTVYLIFRLGKSWFGARAAFVAAILYALMPLPVTFTRNSWNPNLAPLISLLIIWTMDHLRTAKHSRPRWFFVLGILTGILVQLHYMALVFIGLYLLITFFWRFRDKLILKNIFFGLLGFALAMAPFIIFEIRNDWVNLGAILRFITSEDAPNIRYHLPFSLWAAKVGKIVVSLFGGLFGPGAFRPFDPLTPLLAYLGMGLTLLGISFSSLTRKRKLLLLSTVLGSIIILGIYQENIHLHYLGFLFSLVYLGFAGLVSSRSQWLSWTGILAAGIFILYSLPVTWGNISQGNSLQVVKAREVAGYIASRASGQPYNLVSRANTSTTPYQYFAYLEDNPPSNRETGLIFLICQDSPCEESDYLTPLLFITGPAHPSLGDYLGHPLKNYLDTSSIQVISNDHVSNGVWVAQLVYH